MENFAVKTEAKPAADPRFSWRRNFYRAGCIVFRKTHRLSCDCCAVRAIFHFAKIFDY